jgi:hypothetical protein
MLFCLLVSLYQVQFLPEPSPLAPARHRLSFSIASQDREREVRDRVGVVYRTEFSTYIQALSCCSRGNGSRIVQNGARDP